MTVVSYARWRAIWAIALPILAIAIPVLNFALYREDFGTRYVERWRGTPAIIIGIGWYIYALWPSAWRHLMDGPDHIRIDGDELVLGSRKRFRLSRLSTIEIKRPWLQSPTVALQFGNHQLIIETAYQPIGQKKPPEAIAKIILDASRR